MTNQETETVMFGFWRKEGPHHCLPHQVLKFIKVLSSHRGLNTFNFHLEISEGILYC